MKPVLLRLAEILLLFGGLFACMPYIPSHEVARIPLLPSAAFAVLLFAGSRAIRWSPRWGIVMLETGAFAVFVFVLNAAINIVYATNPPAIHGV
ncbi:MAG: hypothetical protein A2885_09210 [Sphingopyxis sp. RIFCSPHIGHO2_01_FULL_65_24]|nr:MAG: hypothetical protein A2885_09210 [Sphingopyxis sp. RIFCSPHIGHO2_01_FULL_65_24]